MINLSRTQKYDSIWFLRSFTYKHKGGILSNSLWAITKECENTKTKFKKQNKIQFKIKSINPIHQTNTNRIITVTKKVVKCESLLKCIRENSIASISKLFEIEFRIEEDKDETFTKSKKIKP